MVGKSVAALRYYEQVGLLVPSLRTEAGYREYSPETVERVRFIVQAQERGFSLREIKAVLKLSDTGSTPCASVAEAARCKVERLEQRIAQLHQRRAVLLDAVRLWESGSLAEAPFCPMLNLSELRIRR
jgi:MerR family copper efflux transcriptional regulator